MMLPRSLKDVVFTHSAEARHVERIVLGEVHFPNPAKSSFLLHGRYGTGKTALAHLLAALLEHAHADSAEREAYDWCYSYRGSKVSITPDNKGKPELQPACFEFINCGKRSCNEVIQQIDARAQNTLRSVASAAQLNHFLLDELDCWRESSQANLKGLISDSPPWNVFYVTTNRRLKIDGGIRSRSISVEMNGGAPEQYLDILRKQHEHLDKHSNGNLLSIVKASRGDWRELEDAACRLF